MIKFWRNRKEVTSEQEKRVWNHIDSLYEKLETGKATKDELKQIDGISKIIRNTTNKRKKEAATQEELDDLTKGDLDMLTQAIGITHVENRKMNIAAPMRKEKRFYRNIKSVGVGIAASILLAWGITLYTSSNAIKEAEALADNIIQCRQDSVLHLMDGTVVYLAGGSDLLIAKDFGKKDRVVSLTGEAFFEVAKDKEKAFIVKTKEMNAIVHGTSFNVVAYKGMVETQVSVRTGCVEVAKGEQSFGNFHHGDRVVYDKATNAASFDTVNPDHIGAWKEGSFILEDATVEELKIRVKNRFGRELVIERNAIPADARINYCSYRSGSSDLDTVMKNICTIYGTHCEINADRVVISR